MSTQHFPFCRDQVNDDFSTGNPPPAIRDPRPADEADWRRLWAGYCTFYETNVAEVVTAATWERMLAPASPLFGRIAERDGRVAGFAISVLHEGLWTIRPCCYLEYLFVLRSARPRHRPHAYRGFTAALPSAALVAALLAHPQLEPEARLLYDHFATADDFVRYRIPID